jgi:predicted nucleic acid-binding protein
MIHCHSKTQLLTTFAHVTTFTYTLKKKKKKKPKSKIGDHIATWARWFRGVLKWQKIISLGENRKNNIQKHLKLTGILLNDTNMKQQSEF